jgi:hypothetical protein
MAEQANSSAHSHHADPVSFNSFNSVNSPPLTSYDAGSWQRMKEEAARVFAQIGVFPSGPLLREMYRTRDQNAKEAMGQERKVSEEGAGSSSRPGDSANGAPYTYNGVDQDANFHDRETR